ncbi:phospholipase Plb2 [Schizosaccharomyces osmophilus]|uniref:Lysophospholipase n=1 Tax=Schizosaccharomyces osmophilus TaxID=2545709 RepID=A0AAE9W7X6_9SCHI|nr:phospholipase Plb2 [Schizosaccharomyces osmophilus]WBW71098.1 phospholipase Plb2 [Schizosaccharomyces osmophilus]
MFFTYFLAFSFLCFSLIGCQVVDPDQEYARLHLSQLDKRNWKKPPPPPSTNASYAPVTGSCSGSQQLLHSLESGQLPQLESDFLKKRSQSSNEALRFFLQSAHSTSSLDLDSLLGDNGPRLGIAVSGGGYRSMFYGGGALAAFDRRSNETTLGGLLQGASYITGADGGSWLVSSLAINDFRTVQNLSSSIWYSRLGIFFVEETHFGDNKNYYTDLVDEVNQKAAAGFNVSLTDYWGRAIARHTTGRLRGGPDTTYSSVQKASWFQDAEYPYPILVSQGLPGALSDGHNATFANSSIYEFSPYYFNTFDNNVRAYMPLEYLGTKLSNGSAVDNKCVTQFDNVGFLIGTSSTRFNEALMDVSLRQSRMSRRLGFTLRHMRINGSAVSYYNNMFHGASSIAGDGTASSDGLTTAPYVDLYDGGADKQNIPVWPLLQPERRVDVVLALDASGDTDNNWPNGTSLVSTYERITQKASDASYGVTSFVHIPSVETFINLGLNSRPTFFGCDGRNTTSQSQHVDENTPPLLVYLPNSPWTADSNIADDRYRLGNSDIQGLVRNGFVAATQNSSTDFASCLACAVVQRSLERTNQTTSQACQQCFSQYCWNGTVDNSPVFDQKGNVKYSPAVKSGAMHLSTNVLLTTLLAILLTFGILN